METINEEILPKKFENSQANIKTVLIIDDCKDALVLQRTILESDGFSVVSAQSGEEALEILDVIHPPHLILLDVNMNGMSGTEFLLKLEQKSPQLIEDVPVVFLTAMDEVPASRAAGMIPKPTNIKEFLKSARRFLELGRSAPYNNKNFALS